MLNLRRSFGILFITLVFSSLHAQQALPPAQHGGNLNRTIDLRSPDAGTIQKKVEYSFDKQNPRHRSLAPTTRSCHTLEVEQQQQAFSPGSTQSDTLFESWMQSSLRQAQQSRSLFRFGPEEVLTIPTVVHVIYSSAIENISDAQVYSQINSLNLDYRRQNPDQEFTPRDFKNLAVDTGIEFCLASLDPQGRPSNGIHRVSFSGAPFNERYLNEVIKPATAWDPNRYFNIWVCALSDNVLGFATFPVSSGLTGVPMQRTSALTDGVVIHYSVFGTTGTVSPPFNKGRTATHEVGHWLGLRHVWGDGPCNVDDFCADTPEADGPHFNCPQGALGCRGSNAMVQNYMDYSDDACMNLFTRDQKARMRLVLQNSPRRGSLLQSGVCIPPVTPPVPAFSANVRQGCAPLEVAFKDLTKGEELSWQWNFPGGRPATSDKQHPVVSYRDPGVYPVSLRAINPAGNRSVTMEGFITVTASGQGLPYFADFEPNEATRSSNYFLNNADNDYTWAISERLGARGRSAQSLAINNYDNKLLNSADWFLLPVLNFSGEPSPELSFDLAYGPFNEKFSDTLGIFVSTGCGTLFRSIYYKGGSKLSTLNGQQSLEPFSPDNQEWRTERIDLRFLAGQTNVQIAFINFNGNGNDVYLDNIRLGSPLPPAPVANFAATNQQVCAGEPITLGDRSSGTTTEGIWSFPGGTPASSQEKNPTVKYEFPGSYDVIYTVRGPGGENSLTKKGFITVAQAPNLQVTGEYEICQGETMNLKASGADQYTWMIGSQTLKTGNSPDFSFAPQKDEVLTVVAKGGQCETRRAIPIRVRAVRPLAVTPASTEICPGEQVSLQATGAMQYIWSPAPPESEAQSGTLTVSPSVTTTYQVNGVNESGCQLTAKVTVTVREAPNALGVTAPRTRICPGDQITLAASGADSYRWSPTTGLSLSDGAQVVASPTTTTTYRLEGTNAFGCRSSRNITIEVTPYPEVQIRSLSPTVCSGAGVTLQARGALRYEWFPSELVSGQGSEAIGRPTQDQVFTVIGKTEAGCADTAQVFVSVIQPEPLTVTATNEVVCPGANTQLLATGAVSYQWNLGTATSTSDRVVVRPFREETYQVIGLDRQGCQSTRSITIKVSEGRSAVADFRADKQITCAGQSVTFSSLSRDATSFRWEFEGGQPAFSTEANPSVVFPSEGSFSVRLEVAGCDGRRDRFEQTDYMYITAPSQISLNTADRVACRGEQVSLVASGGRSYTWSPAIGLDRTSGASVLAMPLATTTYTVSSIDADGCSASRSVTLEVVSAQDVTVSPAKASICVGDSVNLQATGALEYFWTPGTTVSNGRSATFKAKPARTTTYVMCI
ncbi:MAG: PKD domain-containing protein [Bacteroidia bacterium]|nr:PKD domain-containing protein [Bacteroidia bacterium]